MEADRGATLFRIVICCCHTQGKVSERHQDATMHQTIHVTVARTGQKDTLKLIARLSIVEGTYMILSGIKAGVSFKTIRDRGRHQFGKFR